MLALKELQLYDIQETITDACRDEMRRFKRIILMAATGLGKTIIATWMIKQAIKKDMKILFVCDRISLIMQTSSVFSDYGILHGIFQANNPLYAPDLQVQIGSIQTLARRKLKKYDFIILDEIHTFYKAHEKIMDYNKEAFILGLTATPFTDGLGKYFDKHIEPVPMKKLIADGYLCDCEIYGPETIDLSKVRTQNKEYRDEDLAKQADTPKLVADVVETWKKRANGKKTIVFAVNVAHARHLEKVFRQNGIAATEVNGYMLKEGEEGANKIIQDFRDNKFLILISVEMLIKGFDVPDVECIVWATATKSYKKWIQGCGRGLRIFLGKIKCIILDHGSNGARLGYPDEYEFLELDDGKHQRGKSKKKIKIEKLPKKCPSCDFLKPAGVQKCPACKFTPKFIEDVETSEGELKKLKRKAKKDFTLAEKQSFMSQLNQHAENKGYRPGKSGCYGWAIHKYSDKFGGSPPNKIKWNLKEPVGPEVKKFITYCNIRWAKTKKD